MSAASSPLVVAGAGLAGLCVALAAAPRPVLLVGGSAGSASALAQGGVAAAVGPGDRPALHAADTCRAGAGHNDVAMVSRLVDAAPDAVAWLAAQGVAFDREGAAWALGREGGHGRARIVHAGGDASGHAIVAAMERALAAAAHARRLPSHRLCALALSESGAIAAVRLVAADGATIDIATPDLVLATGGIGSLFAATTNPLSADGNGLALALEAGAPGRDLEFVQFHPTALAVPGEGPLPLLTEALRGAGAVLRDDRGEAVMAGRHPLADLAPRDVVAREVWRRRQAGHDVFLDMRRLGDEGLAAFPTAVALCRAHGIDPRRDLAPVTPAAHFHMGGIAVDADGRSGLPGLHAVGEVACSGVHGANRLASNSLLECVVGGRALGARLSVPRDARIQAAPRRWVQPGAGANAAALRALRDLLWRSMGPVRDDATLAEAERQLRVDPSLARTWQARLALRLLHAARIRRASLGAHHRADSE
ncbi:L-aspartate oxidase [Arenimonas sp.]|uniref:L-aspartate oxidase n=1 Tax=Arenimonas sp. TaxID=1872635 RepID=UPI002E343E68|nr:FAD-binding protein [Arenimonas sp.]HEX4854895.1 FAD-binding protein [Arenimonas sp.]